MAQQIVDFFAELVILFPQKRDPPLFDDHSA